MADAAQGIAQSLNSTLLDLNGSLHAPLDPFEVWEQRQHEVQHYRDTHPEEAREARDALISVYLTLFCILAGQSVLVFWKKKAPKSYELVTLAGLWLVPAVVSIKFYFWRFCLVWLGYSAVTGYLLYLCSAKRRMAPTTPRRVYTWFLGVHKVYTWFLGVHKVSVFGGFAGYVITFLELFGLIAFMFQGLGGLGLVLVWYGLYFGVLNRDAAEVAGNRMSSAMDIGRRMAVSVRRCGICDGELADNATHLTPGHSAGTNGANGSVQLACKHLFHDQCIRGWTLIGKKDTCPTCLEKVDLRAIFSDRPWETRNISWIQMLDNVRYMVCWLPIILTALHFVLEWMGLSHHYKGKPDGHFETFRDGTLHWINDTSGGNATDVGGAGNETFSFLGISAR